jgi:lipoate-protein ligase A
LACYDGGGFETVRRRVSSLFIQNNSSPAMATSKQSSRLIDHAPGSGAWNMAIDEVLLESAATQGVATLRFYRWSEPTLSLGYFQSLADRRQHLGSGNCPIVRRTSGGGAIVHDHELTYSLAVPESFLNRRSPTVLYDALHDTLVETLSSWGIHAHKHQPGLAGGCAAGAMDAPARPRHDPFLCFSRRACGDVLVDRFKICGSAQRRHRGAILQHGSVLLGMSPAAKELPGIRELSGTTLAGGELMAGWSQRVAAKLDVRFSPDELSPIELAKARAVTVEKHLSRAWLERR